MGFWREQTGHTTQWSLSWLVGKVEREAGFAGPKARGKLHKLRHTYVTRLAASGATARVIMELAGHTSINTTLRYMHVIDGGTAGAVAALESFDASGSDVPQGVGEIASGTIAAPGRAQN